ncbi:caspase-9 [Drosophila grimshawi]|uniref:GH22881 n=1 Tax=Drosophila grimshawi TaxID=7222 RepID=B4JVS8_DROGR|nr:caspase-9 [Drosophila grimshawi]EDV98066.1 GH22881 [Drosophila grimshawi]
MGWWSKKKSTDDGGFSTDRQALARQDPRTRVNTTSAATETTNTAVQNSTIFDSNKNTVTFTSTRQTVTHRQQARVTEMITRRTPNPAELEELMAQLRMNGGTATATTTTTTTTSGAKRMSPSSLNGVALRSTPSFKHNVSDARRSNTLVRMEQTTVSQKQGRTFTQHVEAKRVVLKPTQKTSWAPKTNSTTTTTTISKPYVSPFALKPVDATTYVSPYANKTSSTITSSVFSKPTVSSSSLSKPTLSSTITIKPTVTRPTLSTPKVTVPPPFISLNPRSSGAVPKSRSASIASSHDAHGVLKPTMTANLPPTKVVATPKKKLKPAEVIIFNQEKFDNNAEYREGSAEDVKALGDTFRKLKCNVEVIKNATVKEVNNKVRKLEQKNYDDRSALVLVILSHGNRNDVIAAKDGEYNLNDDIIFPLLRNRTLQDKPKILFVQACKGAQETGRFKTDAIQPQRAPKDILKCYSTYEGYVSYRLNSGTPFIQTLCEVLINETNVDIESLMRVVRNLVQSYTKDGQVPSVTSTMSTKYVFGDYV